MSYPSIAIILIQANEDISYLIDCLNSINDVDYPNFYIILINNGVKNLALKNKIEDNYQFKFKIEFLKSNRNLGFAGGCNLGIKQASAEKTDYIFLLNNDTIVDCNVLKNLIEFAEIKKGMEIVGPVILKFDTNKIESAGARTTVWASEFLNKNNEIHKLRGNYREAEYISGCAMLISSKIFKIIGLLDENYYPGLFEDTDFCYRAKRKGIKSLCLFNSKIWHKGSKSFSRLQYGVRETIWIKNKILFMFNNFNLYKFIIFLIYVCLKYPLAKKIQNFLKKEKDILLAILNVLKIKILKKSERIIK